MRRCCFFYILLILSGCQPSPESENSDFALAYKSELSSKRSDKISQAPWGIHFNGTPFHDNAAAQYDSLDLPLLKAQMPALIEAAAGLGVKWARVSVDWPLVEDNQGEFHWELFDQMIYGLVEKGISVYPSLHAGHPVHTGNKPPVKPREVKQWLEFVEEVVSRYADAVDYWEIWNEPNTTWFWGGSPDAAEYYALVEASSPLIRELDPGAKVIGGSVARLDVPYLDTLIQLGIDQYIDVVTFHPYSVFPEATHQKMDAQVQMPLLYKPIIHQISELKAILARANNPPAIWQGECGYPSAMNGLGWNGTGPFGETIQAKWILRRAMVDMLEGMGVSAYFQMKDFQLHRRAGLFNYKGLLRYDGSKKPGYTTYRHLAGLMNENLKAWQGKAEIEIVETGSFPGLQAKNVMQVKLEDEAYTYFAYWASTHLQEKTEAAKVNIVIETTGGGEVNFINLLEGKVYSLTDTAEQEDKLQANGLPLQDYPMIVRIKNSER